MPHPIAKRDMDGWFYGSKPINYAYPYFSWGVAIYGNDRSNSNLNVKVFKST